MAVSNSTASDLRIDYMKLLISQLQHQNPLEPLTNNEMAAQMAQFSSLEQLESVNKNFAEVLGALQQGYANSLLGKQVSFKPADSDNELFEAISGVVEQVTPQGDNGVSLLVQDHQVSLHDILSVRNP